MSQHPNHYVSLTALSDDSVARLVEIAHTGVGEHKRRSRRAEHRTFRTVLETHGHPEQSIRHAWQNCVDMADLYLNAEEQAW